MFKRELRYSPFRILEAIHYIIKTGCQWNMLPSDFPKWRCVYNHFRSWSDRGWFEKLMKALVRGRRIQIHRNPEPKVAIIDSQSVKWGVIESAKGIDGFKKVKGIKRNIAVDSQGYPLGIYVSKANVHDSKNAVPLVVRTLSDNPKIRLIKADKGYRGGLQELLCTGMGVVMECVKSNFGTPEFIPLKGRWVVERTFSWLETYRRMTRNYEKLLHVARDMTVCAFVVMMLKFI